MKGLFLLFFLSTSNHRDLKKGGLSDANISHKPHNIVSRNVSLKGLPSAMPLCVLTFSNAPATFSSDLIRLFFKIELNIPNSGAGFLTFKLFLSLAVEMNYFHHKVKIMLEHWRALENPHCAKISIAIYRVISFFYSDCQIYRQPTNKKKKKKRNFVVSAGVRTVFLFFSNTSHDSSHEKKRTKKRLLKPRW